MKKKFAISLIVIGFVLIGSIFFLRSFFVSEEKQVFSILANHPELVTNYEKIKELREKLKENPQNEVGYLVSIGFEWKSLGDLTKNPYFYEKALLVYAEGVQKYGPGNIAFYWNAGKVAEALGKYDVAEFHYREAIRISPTYYESHQNLADLYDYKLKKSVPEVIEIYKNGLQSTSNSTDLFLGQCSFLRRRGEKLKALECYEILVEAYPNNQGFKNVVQELKDEISKNK